MSVKAQISKIEKEIFPTKSGGVDQKILDQVSAIHDRLNQLKSKFDRRKEGLWLNVFGEMPRKVEYDECFEQAKKLTERYGDFENYILLKFNEVKKWIQQQYRNWKKKLLIFILKIASFLRKM
jgi:hypothetical protein